MRIVMKGYCCAGDCGIAENTGMSDGAHLLIPLASCGDPGSVEARRGLQLPHLEKLLARMKPAATDAGDEHSLSMPHERVLARESGLQAPDGCIPCAAWQVARAGRGTQDAAWAWITPCHWRVATDHISMGNPQALALTERDSQVLLEAMRPYFEQDGIALEYDAPTRWLARGEVFRDFPAASLDRVIGRTVDPFLPRSAQARTIRRLQQEMQMLLYTAPLNEERQRGGLLPVNSFWVSGSGALPAGSAPPPPAGLQVAQDLREAALTGDWAAWAAAWQQLDGREVARLLADLERGRDVRLTLCGEANSRSWSSQGASVWRRLGSLVARPSIAGMLHGL
jgi:hypothetical protein